MDDRGHPFPRDETCNKYQGEAARARRARLVRLARVRLVRLRRVEPLVGGQRCSMSAGHHPPWRQGELLFVQ